MSINETLVVNPGENVTLQCTLTGGDPAPQVVWTHSPNPMPKNSLSLGGNLTIWGIQPEDLGYYNCTATNNVGNPAKKTVNLLVRCKFYKEFCVSLRLSKYMLGYVCVCVRVCLCMAIGVP